MDMMISISVKPDRCVEGAVMNVTVILPQRARESPLDSRPKRVHTQMLTALRGRNTLDESAGRA